MKLFKSKLKYQKGQSMIEFSITLPFLAPLILVLIMLLIQWLLVYKDKITLNAATFDAARSGALNHGDMSKMKDALAQGMMPLFMADTGDDPNAIDVAAAYFKAKGYLELGSKITVLNPTSEVFNEFKERRRYEGGVVINEIPNDNLIYRKPTMKTINSSQKLNIQDANLLQIEVDWCKRLEVPIANWVIGKVLTLTDVDPDPLSSGFVNFIPDEEQLKCSALGAVTSSAGDTTYNGYYITIKSYALIRMQTPYRM
ncbi:TadE/TadG family type IV pilus assembly protein [Pseudoalteromonas sp. TB64]|uniref:TadE/TadG family type IV pilus assembly protein n=1 Tax=Pseudoalteromonas sp. TB64 TaxID=1938600 RepID=UPI000416F55F|nr:TadE/TadG family type IV pilus assembly protein [Pseudoalteromonas sp. TB64]